MRKLFQAACEDSLISNGISKVIACTSYQSLDYSSETKQQMGRFDKWEMDSWLLSDYEDGYRYSKAFSKLFTSEADVVIKHKYAGGSMRYMKNSIDEIKADIEDKLDKVVDYHNLLRNQVGRGSEFAVNSLGQSFGGAHIPLSEFVVMKISLKVSMAFVEAAEKILPNDGK
jgi:hypothetical protein